MCLFSRGPDDLIQQRWEEFLPNCLFFFFFKPWSLTVLLHIHPQEKDAWNLSDITMAPFLNNFSELPSCCLANISLSSWSLLLTCVMKLVAYYKLGPRPNFYSWNPVIIVWRNILFTGQYDNETLAWQVPAVWIGKYKPCCVEQGGSSPSASLSLSRSPPFSLCSKAFVPGSVHLY